MKLYRFSITMVYPAETEEEAQELFLDELLNSATVQDPSEWDCIELPRNPDTEYLYRSWEN